jgi:hypothetical protein
MTERSYQMDEIWYQNYESNIDQIDIAFERINLSTVI